MTLAAAADKIMVFVPAYNCRPQIVRVLAQFEAVPAGTFAEILILDNGSTDGTAEAASARGTQRARLPRHGGRESRQL